MVAAQRWILRAGIFLLPLAYSPFTYDQFVLPKLILARCLVAALVVLFFARGVATGSVVVKRTPLDVPLVVFLGSVALSTVFAENTNVALFGTYGRYDGLLTLLTYTSLFWLSVQAIEDWDEARQLIGVLLASGYVVAAIAIFQSLHDSLQPGLAAQMQISGGGFVAAFGSLGNPNILGAFLAIVIPIAAGELIFATSTAARIVLVNVLVVTGLALLLSFSRSSWLGAATGTAFIVISLRKRLPRPGVLAPLLAVLVLTLGIAYFVRGPGEPAAPLLARMLSVLDPHTITGSRSGIWVDSLRMIASRPVLGYGPDNVGLVFPRFQTGDWGLAGSLRQPIDKAHAELLQVAATQGLIGAVAYVVVLGTFLRTFWRARKLDQAVLVAAGWIGYEIVVQLNFTSLAAALPFWMFAAAAMVSCQTIRARPLAVDRRRGYPLLAAGVVAAWAVGVWGAILPYAADAHLRDAVDADYAGRPFQAQPLAAEARQLVPRESVYAVEAGNTAFELDQWDAARSAYQDAARLGTFNPLVYRNLALADRKLGLTAEGREAAFKAVELDRFDPANQALLAEFKANKP